MEAAARWQRDSGRTNQEAFLNLRDVQFGVSGAAFIKCRIIPVMQSTKPTNCTIIGQSKIDLCSSFCCTRDALG